MKGPLRDGASPSLGQHATMCLARSGDVASPSVAQQCRMDAVRNPSRGVAERTGSQGFSGEGRMAWLPRLGSPVPDDRLCSGGHHGARDIAGSRVEHECLMEEVQPDQGLATRNRH